MYSLSELTQTLRRLTSGISARHPKAPDHDPARQRARTGVEMADNEILARLRDYAKERWRGDEARIRKALADHGAQLPSGFDFGDFAVRWARAESGGRSGVAHTKSGKFWEFGLLELTEADYRRIRPEYSGRDASFAWRREIETVEGDIRLAVDALEVALVKDGADAVRLGLTADASAKLVHAIGRAGVRAVVEQAEASGIAPARVTVEDINEFYSRSKYGKRKHTRYSPARKRRVPCTAQEWMFEKMKTTMFVAAGIPRAQLSAHFSPSPAGRRSL